MIKYFCGEIAEKTKSVVEVRLKPARKHKQKITTLSTDKISWLGTLLAYGNQNQLCDILCYTTHRFIHRPNVAFMSFKNLMNSRGVCSLKTVYFYVNSWSTHIAIRWNHGVLRGCISATRNVEKACVNKASSSSGGRAGGRTVSFFFLSHLFCSTIFTYTIYIFIYFFWFVAGYSHNPYNGVVCNDNILATGVFSSKELWRLSKGREPQ